MQIIMYFGVQFSASHAGFILLYKRVWGYNDRYVGGGLVSIFMTFTTIFWGRM